MATAFSTQRLLPRSETSPRLQDFVYLHALRCLNFQTTRKGSIRLQVAVVEYIGPYPDNISIHGNAKSANSEYVRTTPTVMTNIKDKMEVQQPREVYTTLTLDGSTCAPRDLKQVQNAKYQQKKETKPTNQKSANNSDDLQHLLSILGDHPYMQEDIQLKGKPPCIIAYTSDQLQDLKNFCSTEAMYTSVIGVDAHSIWVPSMSPSPYFTTT